MVLHPSCSSFQSFLVVQISVSFESVSRFRGRGVFFEGEPFVELFLEKILFGIFALCLKPCFFIGFESHEPYIFVSWTIIVIVNKSLTMLFWNRNIQNW